MNVHEEIARKFHEEYEARAPQHGWETQQRSRVAWDDLPEENRNLMVGTVAALLRQGVIWTRDEGEEVREALRGAVEARDQLDAENDALEQRVNDLTYSKVEAERALDQAVEALRTFVGFDKWPKLPRVEHHVRLGSFGTITVDGERAYGGKWNPHLQRLLDGVTDAKLAAYALSELAQRAREVLDGAPSSVKGGDGQ